MTQDTSKARCFTDFYQARAFAADLASKGFPAARAKEVSDSPAISYWVVEYQPNGKLLERSI